MFQGLWAGFTLLSEPIYIFVLIAGSVIGIVFGAIPGLGPVIAASLLVPFTYTMDPAAGILLVAGVYVAATFGGSQTAILFNIPGAPENTCTTIDGFPLTKQGKAAKALGIAIIASAVGGIFSSIILVIGSTQLIKISYLFGAVEYFALSLLGIAIITGLSDNYLKALISAAVGVLLSTVGMSSIDGTMRFTFGTDFLLNGFDFIPIMIGAYAVGEVFIQVHKKEMLKPSSEKFNMSLPNWKEIKSVRGTIARSSILGLIVGALPGAGAVLANYLGYSMEESIYKNTDKPLGKGSLNGVAAPEAANNSAAVATFIPLLALGIPGGAVTAILLGVFEVHGLQPGPTLFITSETMVYTLFAGIFIINLLLLISGFLEIRVITKLLKVPKGILYPAIFIFATLGAYSVNNSMFDVVVMLLFGLIGFYMKENGYSVAILVLGMVLGPIMENNLLRALIKYKSPINFLNKPLGGVLLGISIIFLLWPVINTIIRTVRGNKI